MSKPKRQWVAVATIVGGNGLEQVWLQPEPTSKRQAIENCDRAAARSRWIHDPETGNTYPAISYGIAAYDRVTA